MNRPRRTARAFRFKLAPFDCQCQVCDLPIAEGTRCWQVVERDGVLRFGCKACVFPDIALSRAS